MTKGLQAERWDTAYEQGKYVGDPPVEFVHKIIESLGEAGKSQIGLYVGCGNGRNYIPLLESGLMLHGLDISKTAIEQLVEKAPAAEGKVYVDDFSNISSARVFDYIIAIQVFQHGDKRTVEKLFSNASMALKPGGSLFLRTNSTTTQVPYRHHVIEGDDETGKSIVYDEGPKEGMTIHFYSERELIEIAEKYSFEVSLSPYEVTEGRKPPATGTWSQWETVWQKK